MSASRALLVIKEDLQSGKRGKSRAFFDDEGTVKLVDRATCKTICANSHSTLPATSCQYPHPTIKQLRCDLIIVVEAAENKRVVRQTNLGACRCPLRAIARFRSGTYGHLNNFLGKN